MLRVLDITAPDISNGNGVRVTLWVAGCRHQCKGCHNEWTWDYSQGKDFANTDDLNDILNELEKWLTKDYIEGLTISGGDPLCQDDKALEELLDIIGWVRTHFAHGKEFRNIWLYTGYTLDYIREHGTKMQNKVVDSVDVLVDGPYIEELRDLIHTPFRGSTNQKIHYMHQKV